MKNRCLFTLLLVGSVAAAAGAQTPTPGSAQTDSGSGAATPAPGTVTMELPPDRPIDLTPRVVGITPRDWTRDSADAGDLKGVRLIRVQDGAAVLALSSGTRTVRAGDLIGSDEVERVETRRIILTRPAGPGEIGEARVIVKFDAQGRGRVRVFSQKLDVPPPSATTVRGN